MNLCMLYMSWVEMLWCNAGGSTKLVLVAVSPRRLVSSSWRCDDEGTFPGSYASVPALCSSRSCRRSCCQRLRANGRLRVSRGLAYPRSSVLRATQTPTHQVAIETTAKVATAQFPADKGSVISIVTGRLTPRPNKADSTNTRPRSDGIQQAVPCTWPVHHILKVPRHIYLLLSAIPSYPSAAEECRTPLLTDTAVL